MKDLILQDAVTTKILLLRGKKVMLDRDLAELYGVEAKHLKRQVRRNIARFPEDFMLVLTKKEFENWRSQFGTSNSGEKMGLRYAPYAFTEHGILMLSSILNSERAVQVNIAIMRVFVRLREMLLAHKDLALNFAKLEHTVEKHGKQIQAVFELIQNLIKKPPKEELPKRRIGFHRGGN